MFVGYCTKSKGYRLINPENGELLIARDVVFFEHQMYTKANEAQKEKETIAINLKNYEEFLR